MRAIRCGVFSIILVGAGAAAVFLAACSETPDPETARLLQEAQAAFLEAERAGDYVEVAALYQEVLDRGFINGAVLFNQGNAFMRAGLEGRAVAAYRRAARYRPRDPYLRNNLELALGGPAESGRRDVLDYLFFWRSWLSYSESFQAAALAGAATLLLALWGVVRGPSAARRRLAGAALFVTLVLSAGAALDWYRYDVVRHGVVANEEGAEARKGNAESFAPAFSAPLGEGTEFVVREERGDWLLVRLPAGPEGWIRRGDAVLY